MPLDPGLAEALGRPDLPPAFERFRLVLAPGATRSTGPADWAGCLVLVERGVIDVVCDEGAPMSFAAGDLLALGWLPVRALRNAGGFEARLMGVRRRDPPSDRPSMPKIMPSIGRISRYIRRPD